MKTLVDQLYEAFLEAKLPGKTISLETVHDNKIRICLNYSCFVIEENSGHKHTKYIPVLHNMFDK